MNKIIKRTDVQRKTDLGSKTSVSDIMPEGGGLLNKRTLDAKDKAEAILSEAAEEAERIRSEARDMLSQVKGEMEKAKREGYERGRDEGFSSLTEQMVAFQEIKDKFYRSSESEIIKLVMTIAEKVIGKMVREHDAAIKSIVRQAVDSSLGERITVHLSPDDYKVITANEIEFKDIFDRTKRIAFKEDESVKKGGCIVETEVGTIDARLETQLKAIKKALEL